MREEEKGRREREKGRRGEEKKVRGGGVAVYKAIFPTEIN